MTQLHGPQSGHLVRTRRGDDFQQDLQNSDCIVIMGSNMAENHPVGFQWVMEARERGAKVIHIDPRFTRTSAMATKWVGIRAGSDIAFLGGIVNYILAERPLLRGVRQALHERAGDHRRGSSPTPRTLDGLFSGWDPEKGSTTSTTLAVRGDGDARRRRPARGGLRAEGRAVGPRRRTAAASSHGEPPSEDPTLTHPRCVFQLLKRHYARYTPEFVAETCGCSVEDFLDVCEALAQNSGRERTSAFVLRGRLDAAHGRRPVHPRRGDHPAAARQHRPAGRRHHRAARARVDPGLDRHPDALQHPARLPADAARRGLRRLRQLRRGEHVADRLVGQLHGVLGQPDEGVLRRARDARTTTGCFEQLPRIDDDNSVYWTLAADARGEGEGLHRRRREPGGRQRERQGAPARRSRSSTGSSCATSSRSRSASFWYDSPEIESGELKTEEIATEVFFLPAAAHTEKDGSFTNTQRLLQWHWQAVEPKERLPLRALVLLPPRPAHQAEARGLEGAARRARQGAALGLPDALGRSRSRAPRRCSQEISGYGARRPASRSTATRS